MLKRCSNLCKEIIRNYGLMFLPFINLKQGRNQLFISGEAIFMKFHSMTSSCLFNRGTTFSQTVTYNNSVYFCPQTRSP